MPGPPLTSAALAEFAAVARHLSFGKAADELGLHPSVFSRRIAALERQLGVRLLERDTRHVRLTDAGTILLERAADIGARLHETASEIASLASKPFGTLRLAVPNLFGQRYIAPLIPSLLLRHPDLRLEMVFSDHFEDLARAGFDAAVRVGALEAGGNLIVRKLAPNRRVLCASPAYLATAKPDHPAELAHHKTMFFTQSAGVPVWRLTGPDGGIDVPITPVLAANNMEVLRQAALAGMGITILATFVAGADLAKRRLVPVFRDYHPAESTVSIVYRNARNVPRKVRVLVDFLVGAFKGTPPWEGK